MALVQHPAALADRSLETKCQNVIGLILKPYIKERVTNDYVTVTAWPKTNFGKNISNLQIVCVTMTCLFANSKHSTQLTQSAR
jgi:hypothetical protein